MFKVGDLVRVKKRNALYDYSPLYRDNPLKVLEIQQHINTIRIVVGLSDGSRDTWGEDRFELYIHRTKQELICEKIIEMQNRRKALGYKW